MPGALIVGYGNPLRGDDAIGQTAAGMLADQTSPALEILCRHQLTPELAEKLAAVDVVVFIDAVAGAAPGSVAVSQVIATAKSQAVHGHHASPEGLLSLCQEIYHRMPRAFLISVGAASFELGAELSDRVVQALPEVIVAACRLVTSDTPDQLRNESTTEPSGSNT
jgi:hydrogenase maturation protease